MDIFVEFAFVVSSQIGVNSLAIFFDEKDANYHESRIVWPHPYEKKKTNKSPIHNQYISILDWGFPIGAISVLSSIPLDRDDGWVYFLWQVDTISLWKKVDVDQQSVRFPSKKHNM